MLTNLISVVQTLVAFSLVLSLQIGLVLLLRKPVRRCLGAVAGYRLWLLVVLWVPLYVFGAQLVGWMLTFKFVAPISEESSMPSLEAINTNASQLSIFENWLPLKIDWSAVLSSPNTTGTGQLFWLTLSLLWLLGVVSLVAWQSYRWLRFTHFVNTTASALPLSVLPPAQLLVFAQAHVAICSLAGITSAAVFGVRKPLLLLPHDFYELYDADQQQIILAHETVHLRRHDNLWNLGASLLVVVFWLNPLLWLAWRCYRFDQELSCDALALAACTKTQQKRYARTLLDSLSGIDLQEKIGPQPTLSAWDNFNDLKERTLMISQHLHSNMRPALVRSSLALIAAVGAVITLSLTQLLSQPVVAAELAASAEKVNDVLVQFIALLNDKTKKTEAYAKVPELQELIEKGSFNGYQTNIAWNMIGNASVATEHYQEASVAFDKASQVAGISAAEQAQSRYQAGQALLQNQDWEKALPFLLKAVEIPEAKTSNTYHLIAVAYYRLSNYEQAAVYAKQAITLDKNIHKEGQYQILLASLLQQENYVEAKPLLEALIEFADRKDVYQKQLAALETKLAKAK